MHSNFDDFNPLPAAFAMDDASGSVQLWYSSAYRTLQISQSDAFPYWNTLDRFIVKHCHTLTRSLRRHQLRSFTLTISVCLNIKRDMSVKAKWRTVVTRNFFQTRSISLILSTSSHTNFSSKRSYNVLKIAKRFCQYGLLEWTKGQLETHTNIVHPTAVAWCLFI